MALLPLASLVRLQTVSKRWQSIVLSAHFCISHSDEFLQGIQQSPILQGCDLITCTNGVLVTVNKKFELHIIQPSRMICRKIPCLDLEFCSDKDKVGDRVSGNGAVNERFVVGMVGDQATNNCSIIVASLSECNNSMDGGHGLSSVFRLHRYDLHTNFWSSCGEIMEPCRSLVQVVKHRGRYLIMVETGCRSNPFEVRWSDECSSRWKFEQGNFPRSDITHPLLLDHDDRLFLLVVATPGQYVLWEYKQRKSFSFWTPNHVFPVVKCTGRGTELTFWEIVALDPMFSRLFEEISDNSRTLRRRLYRYKGSLNFVLCPLTT